MKRAVAMFIVAFVLAGSVAEACPLPEDYRCFSFEDGSGFCDSGVILESDGNWTRTRYPEAPLVVWCTPGAICEEE